MFRRKKVDPRQGTSHVHHTTCQAKPGHSVPDLGIIGFSCPGSGRETTHVVDYVSYMRGSVKRAESRDSIWKGSWSGRSLGVKIAWKDLSCCKIGDGEGWVEVKMGWLYKDLW